MENALQGNKTPSEVVANITVSQEKYVHGNIFPSQDDEECDEETEDGEDAGVPREVYMCEVLYEMCQ